MHDGRCNEDYSDISICNIRLITWANFLFFFPEWSILLGGLVGGTIASFIRELRVN